MQHFIRHNQFFRNFFITNVIVFLLPLIIVLTGYASTYAIVENEIIMSSQAMLHNTGSVVDKTMEEIENIAWRLAFDSQIQRFVHLEPLSTGSSDLIAVRDAWVKLSDYKLKLTNNYIIDLAISSRTSDITISTNIPYSKYPFYYDTMFRYGDMDYDGWQELFLNTYHSNDFMSAVPVELMGKRYNAIAYLQSIPTGAVNRPRGTLFALIDADQLDKMLSPIQYGPDSAVMVFDSGGRLLLSTNDQASLSLDEIGQAIDGGADHRKLTMNGQHYILTYYKSSLSKWTYVSVHPEQVITQKLILWRRTILILTGGSFLVGILLVIYLSWRNANPINEIYQTIAGTAISPPIPTRRSYDYLKGSISWLIRDQIRLRSEMDHQLEMLEASYLKQLLSNGFMSEAERIAYGRNAGVTMDYKGYLCAIVETGGPARPEDPAAEEMDAAVRQAREIILSIHGDCFFLHTGGGRFAWIYCLNTQKDTELCRHFAAAAGRLLEQAGKKELELRVDVGIPVWTQTDCYQSYQSALSVSEYRSDHESGAVLWYADIVARQECYRFPVETEIQLVNQIKEGKSGNVVREIEHLIAENLKRRTLSTEKYHQFVNTLLLIATRLDEELEEGMHIMVPSFPHLMRMKKDDVGEQMIRLFVGLARRYEEAIHSRQAKLQDQIIAFIAGHYDDPCLTLYEAAKQFGMTESAAYAFIKKYLHTTFASYLENVRIRNACRLLMEGENINDIASRVGYTSPHSFRRAFKRIKGVTPTLYKDLMQDSAALHGEGAMNL